MESRSEKEILAEIETVSRLIRYEQSLQHKYLTYDRSPSGYEVSKNMEAKFTEELRELRAELKKMMK